MKMGNFERKMEIPFSISANTSKIYYIAGASGCGGWMDGPWWNEIGNVSIGIDIPNLLLFCRTFGCLDANDEVLLLLLLPPLPPLPLLQGFKFLFLFALLSTGAFISSHELLVEVAEFGRDPPLPFAFTFSFLGYVAFDLAWMLLFFPYVLFLPLEILGFVFDLIPLALVFVVPLLPALCQPLIFIGRLDLTLSLFPPPPPLILVLTLTLVFGLTDDVPRETVALVPLILLLPPLLVFLA